jgi:hypothetical protein
MKLSRWLALTVIVVSTACSTPVPVRPPPQALEVVAPLLSVSEFETRTMYSLTDGTSWTREKDQFRVLYDLPGVNTLFVAGRDAQGEYVLLVGDQDGLPDGCAYALRYGGRDWGDSIEAQGLLWPKAPGFDDSAAAVQSGQAYPTNAGFCVDDQASVTSVYLAEPLDGSGQAPAASAST